MRPNPSGAPGACPGFARLLEEFFINHDAAAPPLEPYPSLASPVAFQPSQPVDVSAPMVEPTPSGSSTAVVALQLLPAALQLYLAEHRPAYAVKRIASGTSVRDAGRSLPTTAALPHPT
jgi:hypothetical protein